MSDKKVRRLSWKEIYKLCKTSFIEFIKDDSFTHGAALAYYAIFALVPIMYLAISIFGFIVGDATVISIIEDVMQKNMGIQDVSGITSFMKQIEIGDGGFTLKIIGSIVLLFSATAILNALRNSINTFFHIDTVESKRNAVLQNLIGRAISLGILSLFGVCLIIMYFAQTVIFSVADNLFDNQSGIRYFFYQIIEHGSIILVNVIMFAFIFKYLHDGKVKWKLAWGGSLFTSILLYLGQLLIKFYLVNFFFAKDGGVAGTLLVILTWMFYTSQIIFLGAKFTSVYARMVGEPIVAK